MQNLWLSIVLLMLPFEVAHAGQALFDLQIEQRKVNMQGDVIRVTQGDAVTLRWQTDEKVALHMHGYDVLLVAEPGRVAEMHFTAEVSGRFPVTSHGFGNGDGKGHSHGHGHDVLLYIEVYPE
jgi:hypothetical protein